MSSLPFIELLSCFVIDECDKVKLRFNIPTGYVTWGLFDDMRGHVMSVIVVSSDENNWMMKPILLSSHPFSSKLQCLRRQCSCKIQSHTLSCTTVKLAVGDLHMYLIFCFVQYYQKKIGIKNDGFALLIVSTIFLYVILNQPCRLSVIYKSTPSFSPIT